MGVRRVRKKGLLSVRIPGLSKTVEEKPVEKPVTKTKIGIDYPQEGERVHLGHYAIRISGCAGECQISFDGGDWQGTRCDAGYCWYDWFPEQSGSHRITVRTRAEGKWSKTDRFCDVE